jgi:hypothetical protein
MSGAPPRRFPDFFLVGAMKAGTTTVHHLLAQHERIFMPREELFFFSFDDFEEHAEGFRDEAGWRMRCFEDELEARLPTYLQRFAPAGPDQLIGEDSTTYLSAVAVPERIARFAPRARILVVLRDPVERLRSHYWHLVRSGRAVLPLDEALIGQRETLLRRSTYAPGLARYLARFEGVHTLLFEELVADPQAALDGILAFLALPPLALSALDPATLHRHRGHAPRSPWLQLVANWQRRQRGWSHPHRSGRSLLDRVAGTEARVGTPPISADTERFLGELLRRANADLPRLLGRDDLERWWPSFRA